MAAEVKYHIQLSDEESAELRHMISTGKAAAAQLMHARILLKANRGPNGPGLSDRKIAEAVECDRATVLRIKKRCVEEGIEGALVAKSKGHSTPKLDGEKEARLVAITCSTTPNGKERWTLQMLADKLVELKIVDSISREAVRQTLKKKRAKALAKRAMGYPAGGERRFCGRDGRCARSLSAAL